MVSTPSTDLFPTRSEQTWPVASLNPANPRCESIISTQHGARAGRDRSAPHCVVHLATRQRAHWWGSAEVHPWAEEHVAVQPLRGDRDRRLGDAPALIPACVIHPRITPAGMTSPTILCCECPLPSEASMKCGLRSESLGVKTMADAGSTPAASMNAPMKT